MISCSGFILHPKPTILCFPLRLAMAFIRYITYKIAKYLAALNSLMQRTTQHGRKWKQRKGGKTKFFPVFDVLLFLGEVPAVFLQFSEVLATFIPSAKVEKVSGSSIRCGPGTHPSYWKRKKGKVCLCLLFKQNLFVTLKEFSFGKN